MKTLASSAHGVAAGSACPGRKFGIILGLTRQSRVTMIIANSAPSREDGEMGR